MLTYNVCLFLLLCWQPGIDIWCHWEMEMSKHVLSQHFHHEILLYGGLLARLLWQNHDKVLLLDITIHWTSGGIHVKFSTHSFDWPSALSCDMFCTQLNRQQGKLGVWFALHSDARWLIVWTIELSTTIITTFLSALC